MAKVMIADMTPAMVNYLLASMMHNEDVAIVADAEGIKIELQDVMTGGTLAEIDYCSNLAALIPYADKHKISMIYHDGCYRATNGDGVTEEAYCFLGRDCTVLSGHYWVPSVGNGDYHSCVSMADAVARCLLQISYGADKPVEVPDALV